MEKVDCIIIGAGVVGLAVAYVMGNEKQDIILLERHEHFGMETSSRNSEVIHAGIYYPKDSLKARLCVEGRDSLYRFCETYQVPYKKTGKLIISPDKTDEVLLQTLFQKGIDNGVGDLCLIDEKKIKELEPHVKAGYGILSPSTGIFDTHIFMKKLETFAGEKGVMCAYGCEVKVIEYNGTDYLIDIIDADGKNMKIRTDVVINSAGLASDRIAGMVGIDIYKEKYKLYFSKGEYFNINGKPAWYMNHLVYPPPGKTSLGIHTVLDLGGRPRLGPNEFYVDNINYDVDAAHSVDFFHAVKSFLPFLKLSDLSPGMAGIRPKRRGDDDFADFVITDEKEKGLPGFINLVGIDSPGLTSSLAIAGYVEKIYKNM